MRSLPSRHTELDPSQLADVAEAALALELVGLAQLALNAAYDRGNGQPVKSLTRIFAEIRAACITMNASDRLTESQIELLQITNME